MRNTAAASKQTMYMKQAMYTRIRNAFYLGFLLVCFGCALRCEAQQSYYLMEETAAQEHTSDRFEVAEKDYCAAVVRGGAPACLVFSPTTFSPHDQYLMLLSFGSFGHYDKGTYTSKGLTPEQASELSARRNPMVRANEESGIKLHAELSYLSDDPGALALVSDVEIRPGTLAALSSYIQRVEIPAAHAAGLLSFELYQVVAGGDTNRYLLIRRFRTFKQLDGVLPFGDGAMARSKAGESAAKSVDRVRTTVMRVRADLSASK
jgi:hypothetical protein